MNDFCLAMFEQLNGSIRYDPDRLASLRFNPLLSETYKKFSLCSHHDPDANFFTELVDCEYYTEENFNEMLHQKNILEVNNCLSLLYLNIRSLHRNFTLGTRGFSRVRPAGIFGVGRRPTRLRP